MTRCVYEVQRDLAINSGGSRSGVVWDSLSASESRVLHDKIAALLPLNGIHNNKIEEMRKIWFDNVWQQRKYTDKTLLSSIIYVLVVPNAENKYQANRATNFSVHPLFRTRKCTNAYGSSGCCMVFIDETGRVYRNWQNFIEDNVLPKGMMVAPRDGVYTLDAKNDVLLEYRPTAAASAGAAIVRTTDTAVTVGGLAATVPLALSLATPIAAPLIVAASVASLATGVYTAVRSGMQLHDRSSHGQSIALTDSSARNHWISGAAGVVGAAGAGATRALTRTAQMGGNVTKVAQVAVNSLNVTSILLSGTGIANGIHFLLMKVQDNETVSTLDVLQLASSLVVFTHSINNFRLASQISVNNEGLSIRRTLSDYTNKMLGIKPNAYGDSIRALNDLPTLDKLLSLHQQNPVLGANLENSYAAGTFMKEVLGGVLSSAASGMNLQLLATEFGDKFVKHICNMHSLSDVFLALGKYFDEAGVRFILNMTKLFIDTCMENIEKSLNTIISTETIIYKIIMFCIANCSSYTAESLYNITLDIQKHLQQYFDSLNPKGLQNSKIKCNACRGYFFKCAL